MERRSVTERLVPCNGCTECCRGDMVFLHPELGDQVGHYDTQVVAGRIALAHRDDGACVYLTDRGCGIWSARPAVCREFDCAVLLRLTPAEQSEAVRLGAIELRHLRAAAKRVRRGKAPRLLGGGR